MRIQRMSETDISVLQEKIDKEAQKINPSIEPKISIESKIFLTADSHFQHDNIIKHCNRPFTSVEEMNEVMIERWNEVVAPRDIVYHLGDIFVKGTVAEAKKIRGRLNGSIRLIKGNHESIAESMKQSFDWIKDVYYLKVKDPDGPDGVQGIWLSHYAHRVWYNSHHGVWSLYGHSHHQLPEDPNLLSFDIGVDGWNFRPTSYDQVKKKMKEKIEAQVTWALNERNPE
jgi:calcineurin-like phosphoesterase family protein